MFRDSAVDPNKYATVVTNFIIKYAEECVSPKSSEYFPSRSLG